MSLVKRQFQQFDTHAFLWFQEKDFARRYGFIIRLISKTGDGWLYALIAGALLAYNKNEYMSFFTSSILAFSIELPLYSFLKKKFKRNRPQNYIHGFVAKIIPSDEFSFPSGHTAAAFVMATILSLYFPFLSLLFVTWALLIGFSRILLGVHFPGDILAGMILGISCGFISILLL